MTSPPVVAPFTFRFGLPTSSIERARDRREIDDEHGPSFGHFAGWLQLASGSDTLPADPWQNLSLADLAWQLADLLNGTFFVGAEGHFTFGEQEDVGGIRFDRSGGAVTATMFSAHVIDGAITADSDAFAHACRDFVARFCALTLHQVPRLLEWQEMTVIATHLESDAETRELLDGYLLDGVPPSDFAAL